MSVKKNIIILFLALAAINTSPIYGQMPILKHISIEDGLLGSEVYDVLQDKSGYMWFATDFGVSRYDGLSFINYTASEGLSANATIKMTEDYKGRVWFASFSGSLSYYENGIIKTLPINQRLQELIAPGSIETFYVDTADNIYISRNIGGIIHTSIRNKPPTIISTPFRQTGYRYVIYFNKAGILTDTRSSDRFDKNLIYGKIRETGNALLFEPDEPTKKIIWKKMMVKLSPREYIISYANELYHIKNGKVLEKRKFRNQISGLYADKNQNLWISVMYEGVYYFREKSILKHPILLLSGKTLSSVKQDREGNYWFPTLEEGVYFAPSLSFNLHLPESKPNDLNIVSFSQSNEKLYFVTFNRNIYQMWFKDQKVRNFATQKNNTTYYRKLLVDSYGSIWLSGSEIIRYSPTGQILNRIKNSRTFDIIEDFQKNILISSWGGFTRYKNGNPVFVANTIFSSYAVSMHQSKDSTIYLGTLFGVYKYKRGEFQYIETFPNHAQIRISDIESKGDTIYIGTHGKGMLVFTPTDTIHYTQNNGLPSDIIYDIYLDGDSLIWIATNKGFTKMKNLLKPSQLKTGLMSYTINDGLPSNDIKQIIRNENLMWLATSKGLVSFNTHITDTMHLRYKPLLDSIVVNGTNQLPINGLELEHSKNNISIHFKTIIFRHSGLITYQYKLEGYDEYWLTTTNRYVNYTKLPAGVYTFRVKVANPSIAGQMQEMAFRFAIKQSVYETILFRIFILAIILAVLIFIMLLIVNIIKKRMELKQKYLLAEQRALRSQMNPHFLFNSLNSIQMFILTNNIKEADNYLTDFSHLIRKVLENSKSNVVRLEDEILTLDLYLKLEEMRFSGNFTYNISVMHDVNKNGIQIPPMFIQPFIENAIWHGLLPLKGKGHVHVCFMNDGDQLLVEVEDNGIGREKAAKTSAARKNHKSTGVSSTFERMSLINKIYKSTIRLEIVDLKDNEENATGTKIKIWFPCNLQE